VIGVRSVQQPFKWTREHNEGQLAGHSRGVESGERVRWRGEGGGVLLMHK